ncbi:hypothetical protein ACAG39_01955 [Caldicellulosiruptoraceae bacterium PP1]
MKRFISLIRNTLKDKKGNSEITGALIILPLIISISLNPIIMFLDLQRYQRLEEIGKTYIIRMETEGGLTTEAYSQLLQSISNAGFDLGNTQIDYTPSPVDFGNEVKLKITTQMTFKRISIIKAGGLTNETKAVVVGPYYSVSKKNFEKQ